MGGVCRIGEFETRIGRSVSTVRRWEADVRKILQPRFTEAARFMIVYCQVSSVGQKDGPHLAGHRDGAVLSGLWPRGGRVGVRGRWWDGPAS
jgi:hypothetical protein